MHHRLRTYLGETETALPVMPQLSVRFAEIQALLTDAIHQDCSWLSDFADDNIQLTPDLYDVLMAYRRFRKSA